MYPDPMATNLARALGRGIKAAREAKHLTQEQLAARLRDLGLDWSRATVASVETGRRDDVGITEIVIVAFALGTSPAELIPSNTPPIVLAAGLLEVSPNGLRRMLSGTSVGLGRNGFQAPRVAQRLQQVTEEWREITRLWPALARRPAEDGMTTIGAISRDQHGEAEQHAARRLGRSPLEIAVAAHRAWGRGFRDERERRLDQRARKGSSRASLSALRGRVTRELLEELRPLLQERGKQ